MYGMMKIVCKPEDIMNDDRCTYVIIKDEVTIRYIKPEETEYTYETLNFMGADNFGSISYELAEVRARIGVPYEIKNIKTDITWHDTNGKEYHTDDPAFRGLFVEQYRKVKRKKNKEKRYSVSLRFKNNPSERDFTYDNQLLYSEEPFNFIFPKIYEMYQGKYDIQIWNIESEFIGLAL